MNLSVVRDFFLFRTSAFQTVARHPAMLWLGPLMVLAAGFAREYDQEYLLAEPWHLLLPLLASAIGILVLTSYLAAVSWFKMEMSVSFFRQLRAVAGIYWMTAPLAWLYAIPIEYFSQPLQATKFNLGLLLLVSVYRVALMSNGVNVLYGVGRFRATILVLLFSDALALIALAYMPIPIFMVMGGIRLTPNEDFIQQTKLLLGLVCWGTLPVWIVTNLILIYEKYKWLWQGVGSKRLLRGPAGSNTTAGIKSFVAIQLILGLALAICFLPTQARKWQLVQSLTIGDYQAAAAASNQYDEAEFPPHMDLPPRTSYGDSPAILYRAFLGLDTNGAGQWLMEIFRQKIIRDTVARDFVWIGYEGLTDADIANYVKVIGSFDEPAALIEPQKSILLRLAESKEMNDGKIDMSPERFESIRQLLRLGGIEIDDTGQQIDYPPADDEYGNGSFNK